MQRLFRFSDWQLRSKMASLIALASIVPLAIAAFVDIREARQTLMLGTSDLLGARADQLRDKLDEFHTSYIRSSNKLAHLPEVVDWADSGKPSTRLEVVLGIWPSKDRIRGVGILDLTGKVQVATESKMIGQDLSFHRYIREAITGKPVISDIHIAQDEAGNVPTIAYTAPIFKSNGKLAGIAAVWVRAESFWSIVTKMNGLAQPGSYGIIFDDKGIRVAHTFNREIVFRPAGQIDPEATKEILAEKRFGSRTKEILADVKEFPGQFERSRATKPDEKIFRGFSPTNSKWNYGLARRFEQVPWTVFYMVPEDSIVTAVNQITLERTRFAATIIVIAIIVGALFATLIARPIHALSHATKSIADGDMDARVRSNSRDEFGLLGSNFNAMADQIQSQARSLHQERDLLEARVNERTADLLNTTQSLEAEIVERKEADAKVQAHLGRLNLLHHITRATGERQDLKSIFQVVIRSVEEQLPVDFACVCLYDPIDDLLTVTAVGAGSETLTTELAMAENAQIPIDENGLSACVRGRLVHEPDISNVEYPFPSRLAKGGLRSLVMAPLLVESQVFGILVTARVAANSFSSGECEFLRQLSEHVALAAHQAKLHDALQLAYNDLQQTQQAVMQQERLKALGQMASGIAHDINNAISPVALYTESLLMTEPNLSGRARDYLETIARSIDDVAATVSRMREFYRQREPQLTFTSVPANRLVREVIDLTRARWSDMPQQRGTKIELTFDLQADLPAIMGVESEIREMLTNLIFNAVDAMPEGGNLTIQTKSVEKPPVTDGAPVRTSVLINVIDDGIGMDQETQRRCLEPFFTTKGERGTGLGMAMVYGVLQRHNATIEIESELGKGTMIQLIFDAAPLDGTIQNQSVWEPAILPRLRILIVDDDPLLLKSLRETLESTGHVVTVANGGQAGIDTFSAAVERGEVFPIVITDLGMPYVDGRTVAASIKELSPKTFVVMLTGWGQRLVAEGEVPPHVDCVLNKPPKMRDINEALVQSLTFGGE